MAWAPLLLALLTYCSGASSQYVVTQEPSLLVSPGGNVKLSCRLSIVSDITSVYPYWIQQRGGGVPRLLIYNANVKVSGTPERFSGSSSGFKKQAEKAPLNSETPVAECAVPRMAWVTTLLVLVACWAGSSYQFTLTQPLAMSVTPGETVQLACVLSSKVSISDSYIRWYQQKQGEKPRYLLYYKDDSTQGKGSGVPDRFTASKDTSRHTCFLTISRAQAEDDADYYCADWDGSANQYTVIQLHGEEEQKPLSPIVTQRREPTCVSLVPIRWPGGLAPGSL